MCVCVLIRQIEEAKAFYIPKKAGPHRAGMKRPLLCHDCKGWFEGADECSATAAITNPQPSPDSPPPSPRARRHLIADTAIAADDTATAAAANVTADVAAIAATAATTVAIGAATMAIAAAIARPTTITTPLMGAASSASLPPFHCHRHHHRCHHFHPHRLLTEPPGFSPHTRWDPGSKRRTVIDFKANQY